MQNKVKKNLEYHRSNHKYKYFEKMYDIKKKNTLDLDLLHWPKNSFAFIKPCFVLLNLLKDF